MITVSISRDQFTPCRWRSGIPPAETRLPAELVWLARYLGGGATDVIATPAKVLAVVQEVLERSVGRDWELSTHDRGLVGLRIGARGWGILLYEPVEAPKAIRVCRVCGCTEQLGCRGRCYWVYGALCSACQVAMTAPAVEC